MKYLEDVLYVVLLALLVPVFIAFGWIIVGVILISQTWRSLRRPTLTV